jgi:xanthine dehydrogenase small subunit
MTIRFLLDNDIIETEAAATDSVLDLLRYRLRRTGTKEGCAEGDCGACTVLLGEPAGDGVQWRAVNACILFVPMLDGKALMTVESLGGGHPVQHEMVTRHGSQCGFCTPGFVMSLVGRSMTAAGTEGVAVGDVIAGNLCRCTGYGPILAAGEAVPPAPRDDSELAAQLRALQRGEGQDWFAPRTADELAALLVAHPQARIVAGATDVGLWVTKQHRDLGTVIFLGDVADLRTVSESDAGLTIGAGARYADARAALTRLHPDLGELVRRIAGVQVRNTGTIGGNIANGSPIGDMPPALIALGATLTLRRGDTRRTIALEDFFIAYGKQDRSPGEFVESIFVPRPAPTALIRIVKLSKRFDSDISAVCGAIALDLADGMVAGARVAFGGMAATPKRAPACEAALTGAPWCEATIEAAAAAIATDYAPLDDLRGSAGYRLTVAANLLRRLWAEQAGVAVSVLEDVDG